MINLHDKMEFFTPEPIKVETVLIPEPAITRMTILLKGTTPLLTNRFSERSLKMIEDAQTRKAKQAREPRNPHQEFLDARHIIKKGPKWEEDVCGFPAIGIKESVVATGMRVGDEKGTILKAAISVTGDLLEIKSPTPPIMRTDYVRLRTTSTLAYRPAWWPWTIEVPVVFLSNVISEAQVVNLFRMAGFAIGIGCWRPSNKGTMGQFEVVPDAVRIISRPLSAQPTLEE